MSNFKRFALLGAAIIPLFLLVFCGKGGNPAGAKEKYGMIEIRARMVNQTLAKAAGTGAVAATVAEKLVIEVSGADLAPTRVEKALNLSRPTVIDTVKKVPVGKNRSIVIWAVDKNGKVTHIDSVGNRGAVNIEATVVTPVFLTLIPAAGSIYLQFMGLQADVSRVHASFTTLEGTLIAENSANKATHTSMSLDGIPHMTEGVLRVSTLNAAGDTLYIAAKELKFNARGDNIIDLQFMENVGMLGADITVYTPGVTTGAYDFSGKSKSTVEETGELVITEIMWNAGNENYIELYNTTGGDLHFDELITDIDGLARSHTDVTVNAGSYLVIGRYNLPFYDYYTSSTGGLPITSTGNWITIKLKDGTVIDRVICPNSTNNAALGWPVVSGRRSIELDRNKYNAVDNNFGKNWKVTAAELIPGIADLYGTPGR